MPQCQFLFSAVFGSRKAVRAIFSEFDETKTKHPIFPGRLQNTEGESEESQGATTHVGRAAYTLAASAWCGATLSPLLRRLFAYIKPPSRNP